MPACLGADEGRGAVQTLHDGAFPFDSSAKTLLEFLGLSWGMEPQNPLSAFSPTYG
jgi:hypothetical protein